MIVCGVAGYVLRKANYDLAPLLLAFVLGDRIEINFRRALTISDGDASIFIKGPAAQIAMAVVVLTALSVGVYRYWKRTKSHPLGTQNQGV
jgi:putative tricarboxylic transport membrane protein